MEILNLTQHRATEAQISAGVVEPSAELKEQIKKLLTFHSVPDKMELFNRAMDLAMLCRDHGYIAAMIGGAGYLMPELTKRLKDMDVIPLFAFTKRIVEEKQQPDGTVKKTAIFKFEGFVRV